MNPFKSAWAWIVGAEHRTVGAVVSDFHSTEAKLMAELAKISTASEGKLKTIEKKIQALLDLHLFHKNQIVAATTIINGNAPAVVEPTVAAPAIVAPATAPVPAPAPVETAAPAPVTNTATGETVATEAPAPTTIAD